MKRMISLTVIGSVVVLVGCSTIVSEEPGTDELTEEKESTQSVPAQDDAEIETPEIPADLTREGEECLNWAPPVIGADNSEEYTYLKCSGGFWVAAEHLLELTNSGAPKTNHPQLSDLTQDFKEERQVWLPVLELIDRNSPPEQDNSDSFEFIYSSTIDQSSSRIQDFQSRLAKYINYWSPQLNEGDQIKWVLMEETDYAFYSRTVREIESPPGNTYYWDSGRCGGGITSENICAYGGPVDSDGNAVMYAIIGSEADLETRLAPVFYAHEGVHAFQTTKYGYGQFWPCWVGEGQATLFQNGIAIDEISVEQDRNWIFTDTLGKASDLDAISSEEDALSFIQKREPNDEYCSKSGIGYAAGMLFNEKVIFDFGFDSYFNWLDRIVESRDWKISFNDEFGVDVDTWYEVSFAPYLSMMVSSYK